MTSLPSPTPAASVHSQQLLKHILSQIRTNRGAISFAKYMDFALYTPQQGYYSAGMQKFGKEGDFITAPELSPLFSQCLARQCQQILHHLPKGDILEIGAGTGKMAAHILIELAKTLSLPNHYFILELSAHLKNNSKKPLPLYAQNS